MTWTLRLPATFHTFISMRCWVLFCILNLAAALTLHDSSDIEAEVNPSGKVMPRRHIMRTDRSALMEAAVASDGIVRSHAIANTSTTDSPSTTTTSEEEKTTTSATTTETDDEETTSDASTSKRSTTEDQTSTTEESDASTSKGSTTQAKQTTTTEEVYEEEETTSVTEESTSSRESSSTTTSPDSTTTTEEFEEEGTTSKGRTTTTESTTDAETSTTAEASSTEAFDEEESTTSPATTSRSTTTTLESTTSSSQGDEIAEDLGSEEVSSTESSSTTKTEAAASTSPSTSFQATTKSSTSRSTTSETTQPVESTTSLVSNTSYAAASTSESTSMTTTPRATTSEELTTPSTVTSTTLTSTSTTTSTTSSSSASTNSTTPVATSSSTSTSTTSPTTSSTRTSTTEEPPSTTQMSTTSIRLLAVNGTSGEPSVMTLQKGGAFGSSSNALTLEAASLACAAVRSKLCTTAQVEASWPKFKETQRRGSFAAWISSSDGCVVQVSDAASLSCGHSAASSFDALCCQEEVATTSMTTTELSILPIHITQKPGELPFQDSEVSTTWMLEKYETPVNDTASTATSPEVRSTSSTTSSTKTSTTLPTTTTNTSTTTTFTSTTETTTTTTSTTTATLPPCVYTDWNEWTDCYPFCEGTRVRMRRTNMGAQINDHCLGWFEEANCSNLCVDCKWDDWQDWSDTCPDQSVHQQGTRTRIRDNTPQKGGGQHCEGDSMETEKCPIDCYFTDWSDWSSCPPCSTSAVSVSTRQMVEAQNGGLPCFETHKEQTKKEKICFDPTCRSPCTWDDWREWSVCTATCGAGGTRERQRNYRPSSTPGVHCRGVDRDQQDCSLPPCPTTSTSTTKTSTTTSTSTATETSTTTTTSITTTSTTVTQTETTTTTTLTTTTTATATETTTVTTTTITGTSTTTTLTKTDTTTTVTSTKTTTTVTTTDTTTTATTTSTTTTVTTTPARSDAPVFATGNASGLAGLPFSNASNVTSDSLGSALAPMAESATTDSPTTTTVTATTTTTTATTTSTTSTSTGTSTTTTNTKTSTTETSASIVSSSIAAASTTQPSTSAKADDINSTAASMEILDKLGEAGVLNKSGGLPFTPKSGENSTEAVIQTIVGALENRLSAKPAAAAPCNLSKALKEAEVAKVEAEAAKEAKVATATTLTTPPASTSVELLRSGDMLIKRGGEVEVVKAAVPNVTKSDSTTQPYPAQSLLETHSALSDVHPVEP
ncbi:Adgrb3 [Symbiodinium sp. KB8]|nr:Adgrb3 [Symbiodinium sp. KB8]